MGAEYNAASDGHLVEFVDKDDALLTELVDDELVVNDFAPDVDGLPVSIERQIHDINRPNHSRAESPRECQDDFLFLQPGILFRNIPANYTRLGIGTGIGIGIDLYFGKKPIAIPTGGRESPR